MAIRGWEAGRARSVQARIELDARGVPRLGRGDRAGGQAAVEDQFGRARIVDVADEELSAREDGRIDVQIAATRDIRRRDLDALVADETEIVAGVVFEDFIELKS